MRTVKTLIRLCGCPGWSESSLGAQPLCWFCHEAAPFSNPKILPKITMKLQHYGVRGNLNRWVADFLTDRQQEMVLEGVHSKATEVISGVPQGTVLRPVLFLVFINDMPEKICSTIRLFADDSLVYRNIRLKEDQAILQEDLNKLQKWERDWLMQFNPDKCEVVRITNKRNPLMHKYYIHGTQLQTVKDAKYLGVTIGSSLSWNKHVDNTVKKATTSLNFLKRNLSACPTAVKDKCYTSLVRPIMEYTSCVWDSHTQRNMNKLEMVQRRAAQFVTGDSDRTSSVTSMLADLHWNTLQERRMQSKSVIFYRIVHNLVAIPATPFLIPARASRRHNMRFAEGESITLQNDLHILEKWEQRWDMSFNPSKCQVLHITRAKCPIQTRYILHGPVLESVPWGDSPPPNIWALQSQITFLGSPTHWFSLQESKANIRVFKKEYQGP